VNPHDLIDTTEMYLRTVLQLEEEGTVPLRARVASCLGQTVQSVMDTTARMERDRLIALEADRSIRLTREGRRRAVRVMRKHRLAECFLADVIGLDWHLVHDEACRWEHVISESVERRLVDLLGHPRLSPFGNPIPGLAELEGEAGAPVTGRPVALSALPRVPGEVIIASIGESLQSDAALLASLSRAGIRPGGRAFVGWSGELAVIGDGDSRVELNQVAAACLFAASP
jgi:DtxR family transcriptional regulator, Mn-dependent transcriptional regulator